MVIAAFFTLLLVSSWLTTLVSSGGIEKRLKESVLNSVSEIEGFPLKNCEIVFQGLEGRISGTVHDRAHIADVDRRVNNLEGVRLFRNDLIFHRLDEPHLLVTIHTKQKTMAAQGLLPKGDWKLKLEKELRGLNNNKSPEGTDGEAVLNLEEWKVEVSVEEKKDVFEPKWIAGIGKLLPELLRHKRAASFQIKGDTLTLSGELFSAADNSALLKWATDAFSGAGVLVHNEFRVVPPPLPPFLEIVWENEGQKRTLDGEVMDEDARRKLTGRLMELIPPVEKREGGIRIGTNIDDIPWEDKVVAVLPGLMGETREGSFSIKGREVAATGEVASHGMRESLLQLLEQTFPSEEYERKVDLTVYEPPRPSMVSIINMMGESVRLKGLLPDEATKKKLFDEARNRLPEGMDIGDEIEVKSSATNPDWLPALLDIMPGFVANSINGGLTVYGNSIAIEARVDSDAKWDAMYVLAEKYFPTPAFQQQLIVTLVDPTNPEEDLGPLDPDSLEEEMGESEPDPNAEPDPAPEPATESPATTPPVTAP